MIPMHVPISYILSGTVYLCIIVQSVSIIGTAGKNILTITGGKAEGNPKRDG
jgi:hypothetical protein